MYLVFVCNIYLLKGEYGDDNEFTVFYIGSSQGQVYKISQWMEGDKMKSQLLDVFQVRDT